MSSTRAGDMRVRLVVLTLCLWAPAVHAQERLNGTWQGFWIHAGDSLPNYLPTLLEWLARRS